eukprot:SAG31_NODE_14397_length_809_cov_1.273239_1_plen_44_part_10
MDDAIMPIPLKYLYASFPMKLYGSVNTVSESILVSLISISNLFL